jgi:hypothetical protein
MANISEVYIIDVSKIMPHRTTKYGICVSAGENRYFLINSDHREIYDDLKISNYDFLKHDSYVGCSKAHEFEKELIKERIGAIDYDDMAKILDKVKKSKHLDDATIETISYELETWLEQENYAENKLKNKFKKR